MSDRAARRARACFALASAPSATQGERAAALDRGLEIVRRYGLDPDRFAIPGRPPPVDWVALPVFTLDQVVRDAVRATMQRRAQAQAQGCCPMCGQDRAAPHCDCAG